MENKEETNLDQENIANAAKIRFSPEEEQNCYIALRSQLIKLLYMIEAEQRGESNIDLWFYGFMFDLASANVLCSNRLTRVVVKIHGLYDNGAYKNMTHA